jgi:hypothetical protein
MSNLLTKRFELLRILLMKTEQGKISWESGPVEEMFYTGIAGVSVGLKCFRNDYYLHIYNSNGDLAEAIVDTELTAAGFENAYHLMKSLYDLARAHAKGAEAAVDALLGNLKDL